MPAQPPVNVLYVETDQAIRQRTSGILRHAGLRVMEAATTDEALDFLRESPDIVLCDEGHEGRNGSDVIQRIREHRPTRPIPVVHFSAHGGRATESVDSSFQDVKVVELVSSLQAVTRIRRTEEERDILVRELQSIMNAVTDGVCCLDYDGRIVACNPAFARCLDHPTTNIVGLAAWEIDPPVFELAELPAYQRVLDEARPRTATHRVNDRWFQVSVHPIQDELKRGHGAVCVCSEFTMRKRMEDQLRLAQQVHIVGLLAGGLAHDFNNMLTAILGNVSLLLENPFPPERATEVLKIVEKAALRAAGLVRQLLGSTRLDMPLRDVVDLDLVVAETVSVLRSTFDPRITLRVMNQSNSWRIQADASQVNQIVLNLCLNARDAMPEGGTLTLKTENVVVEDLSPFRHENAHRGEFVRLRVNDTGAGIAASNLERIFEPFFTTKPSEVGTGLGLAVVDGILRLHEGWIECASTVGQGTTFDVYLPRASATNGPND